jgi:hypothetical protein
MLARIGRIEPGVKGESASFSHAPRMSNRIQDYASKKAEIFPWLSENTSRWGVSVGLFCHEFC